MFIKFETLSCLSKKGGDYNRLITLKKSGYDIANYEYLLSVIMNGKINHTCEGECMNCKVKYACSDINSIIGYVQKIVATYEEKSKNK